MNEIGQSVEEKSCCHTIKITLPTEIVAQGLCTRCGYCVGICPQELIEFDDNLFPQIAPEDLKRCTQCGLCSKGCAAEIDLPQFSQKLFGQTFDALDSVGIVQNLYIGYACDPEIRYGSSSGGVVTALLLYLLEAGLIDQALVCGMRKNQPWEPEPILADTKTQIIESAQSKYNIVPQLSKIGQLLKSPKATAIVGLPCHLHGYRKLEQWQTKLADNVPLVIGLACNCTLEKCATQKLLEINNISPDQVAKFEYRGGKKRWGDIRVKFIDGRVKKLYPLPSFKEAFKYLSLLYAPKRCLACIDFSAELSDLTVLDPNIRDSKGGYVAPEKSTLIIVRTNRGQEIIERAISKQAIALEKISAEYLPSQFNAAVRKKKIAAPIHIDNLRRRNKPYPDYNINFPPATFKQRLFTFIESLKRICSKYEFSRRIALRFAFSPFGTYLSYFISTVKGRSI